MSEPIKFDRCECSIDRGRFDIRNIPLDCPVVWDLISSGYTTGIFQLETKLGQDWARKVRPRSIRELSDLISILRPGPLESNMSQDYVDVKFGRKPVEYLHPVLKPILEPTYSALLYQEQSLKIAVEIAGFSLIQADSLRKSLGKKDSVLMAKARTEFVEGAVKKGLVTKAVAEEIFGWIEKGQRYLFNLSHSISYATLGYQTAWIKAHLPHEFYASYLTYAKFKGDEKEEIYKLVQDARLFGIETIPPDIRLGNPEFRLVDGRIAYGLANVRGVGDGAINRILEAGQITTWPKFLDAVPGLHRNVGEALIKSGACDCYGLSRSRMIAELQVILGTSVRDEQGERVDVKGLTDREKDWFFTNFHKFGSTVSTLQGMMNIQNIVPVSRLTKKQVIETILELSEGAKRDDICKMKRAELNCMLKELGYDPGEQMRISPSRRSAILDKIKQLDMVFEDTPRIKAEAEKYFLGIALSCSPVDGVGSDQATHTCVDVARALSGEECKVCAIIDMVKHTKTKKGKNPGSPMCFVTLSDSTYSLDHAVVFPDAYQKNKDLCTEDLIVLVTGTKRDGSFIVSDMKKLI